jgi:hypothetical protein
MLLAAIVLANPTITLDVPADRLPNVLASLGEASDLKLECTASLAREVVVMRIEGRPRDEVLARFASALDAEWTPTEGGFRLHRSADRVKALRAAQAAREVAAYAGWMRKVRIDAPFDANGLAKKMKGIAQAYRPRQDPMIIRNANEDGPAYRALIRALQTVGSRALAAIPIGGRVVYATQPTPAQRPLSAPSILRQYTAEQKAWVEAANRHGVRPPRIGGSTIIPSGLLAKLNTTEAPRRMLLELARHSRGPSVAASVTLVDAQGRIMDKASVSPGWTANLLEKGKTPLELSPDAIAIGGFWIRPDGPSALSDELRGRLADPIKHEPLRIVPGDLLPKVARRRALSLIATLPDSTFLTGTFLPKGGPLTEEVYLERLALDGVDVAQTEGWLLGRIFDPALREAQVDRRLLTEFVRMPLGEGLEVAADWAARLPEYLDNHLPFSLRHYVLGVSDPTFDTNDPRTLRFYGTLTAAQRKAATEGLSLGSLSTLQRERLQPLLGLVGKLDVEGPRPSEREDDSGEGDIFGEPTEALPNGVPRNGILIAERSQREVALAGWRTSNSAPMALTAREFVDQEMAEVHMRRNGHTSGLNLQSLQRADQEVLTLRLRLTENVSALRTLTAVRTQGGKADLSAMSPAYRQEVEKIRARWRSTLTATPPP